jgi:hypothetical protein
VSDQQAAQKGPPVTVIEKEAPQGNQEPLKHREQGHAPWKPPARIAKQRPAFLAVALSLALLGGLITWYGVNANGQRPVIVAKSDILRGETIEAADLGTIEVAKDASNIVPAEQSSQVIGQKALVDMPAGSLFTGSHTGSSLGVEEGKSVVGIGVGSTNVPSRPLRAGDRVRIIQTPLEGQAGAASDESVPGIVDATRFDEVKGITVVDVIVDSGTAPTVVQWSAAGTAGISLEAGEGSGE